jgi:hypothetical protein
MIMNFKQWLEDAGAVPDMHSNAADMQFADKTAAKHMTIDFSRGRKKSCRVKRKCDRYLGFMKDKMKKR